MKRIYLMRHSKAGQTNKRLISDHERILTKKGEEQVPLLAAYFIKNYKDNPPELIITSTALRAKQTAALFKKNFSLNTEIDIKSYAELYLNVKTELLAVLRKLDDKKKSVLIISHVPGLQDLAVDFAYSGDKAKFRDMRANFPPGSFATFDVDVKSWKDLKERTGILLDFVNAKKLKKAKNEK